MNKAWDELCARIEACWGTAKAIEPARGEVSEAQLASVRDAVESAKAALEPGVDGVTGAARTEAEGSLATAIARSAAVAIAAGDDDLTAAWLTDARRLSKDEEQRLELDAAIQTPERYRLLVHARNRFIAGERAVARAHWQALADDDSATDAIRETALNELDTEPPYTGKVPELYAWNGFGLRFMGSRDERRDGSYVTHHCVTALFLPVFPLAAYRVQRQHDRYRILGEVPMTPLAKRGRIAVVAVAALAVVAYFVVSHLRDPDRLARKRFDAAITAQGNPEDALRRLDAELEGPDLARVDDGRAQRAGASVVRITASYVPDPLTRDSVDQIARVVARYESLPARARGGAAQDAILHELEDWATALDKPDDRDARLGVLRRALAIADHARAQQIEERITELRIAVAADKSAAWPVDALAVLLEPPASAATISKASEIVARLVDHPSLLEDAGADLDVWLQARSDSDPLRAQVEAQRALAIAVRDETVAEDVTPAKLAAMQAARPWDQRVAVALAAEELHGGKPEAAEARLRAFGPEGMLVRDARYLLAQVAAAREQLDVADVTLTRLLDARLPRFQAASAALDAAIDAAQERLSAQLDAGDVPADLRASVEATSDEEKRNELVGEWFRKQMETDTTIAARRTVYLGYSDVVHLALSGGTIKLRRAQRLSGGDRDQMLAAAERSFLAIRTEAEGRPEFHLGLGEIYARLGKHEESDKELGALVEQKDPELTMQVVDVYRNIGSVERATAIATDAYGAFDSPMRERFASFLGVLHADDEDESEKWFKKADQSNQYVKDSLLGIEGQRLMRQGKEAECAEAFAAIAASSSKAGRTNATAYNNAAVAHQYRYICNGDPRAIDDAKVALETAYRLEGEQPIVVFNLLDVLQLRGQLRVLGRRVDTRALRLTSTDAENILDLLLEGPEHDQILAELIADPDLRRSRDMLHQYQVLAPNSARGYMAMLMWAEATRDASTATAVMEQMKQAKALDTSDERRAYERRAQDDADDDAKASAKREVSLARLDKLLALPRVDATTRAVALRMRGNNLFARGIEERSSADLAAARAAWNEAGELWPALDDPMAIAGVLIDQIAVQHDAERWQSLRRRQTPIAALATLARDRDPLAATIMAGPTWADVREHVRRDRSPPGSDLARVATLLGDPEISERAAAARENVPLRKRYEAMLLIVPSDAETRAKLDALQAP